MRPGSTGGRNSSSRRRLHRRNQVRHAAFDQTKDVVLDLAGLDVVQVQVEQILISARAHCAGDDAAHAQRHAGAAQTGEIVDAGLGAPFALHAQARAELFRPAISTRRRWAMAAMMTSVRLSASSASFSDVPSTNTANFSGRGRSLAAGTAAGSAVTLAAG